MSELLEASVKRAHGVSQSKCENDKVIDAEREKALNFLEPYVKELNEFFQEIKTLGFSVNVPEELVNFNQVSYPDSLADLRREPVDLAMLDQVLLKEEGETTMINVWCPLCFTWVVFIGTGSKDAWYVALTKSKYEGIVIFFCTIEEKVGNENTDRVYSVASLKNIIAAKIETFIAETGYKSK